MLTSASSSWSHFRPGPLLFALLVDGNEISTTEDFDENGLVKAFPKISEDDVPDQIIDMRMTPDGNYWWLAGMEGEIVEVSARSSALFFPHVGRFAMNPSCFGVDVLSKADPSLVSAVLPGFGMVLFQLLKKRDGCTEHSSRRRTPLANFE